ncbi:MAG: shikimate kinase [Burkholderiales bacterium RIFCSPHIGHO2_01_FULL_63_240]|jgi:shikimate kinase|nr:MAG: shikimate kinase [Burkholderiales bacterium RIFCSPHIGHO2_01_FULL_63_240]
MSSVVALVGLPGGGKSTVGRQLARRLGARFLDADAVLEERIGMPIRSYFEQHGEQPFRDLEEQVIDELTSPGLGPLILATGGGAVLREGNRKRLHERTTVIYLRSTPEELFKRLRHDTQRPLLQVADPLAKLRELHAQRHPLYEEVAHYRVDTGRPSVATLVNMILMQLDMAGLVPELTPANDAQAASPAPLPPPPVASND